VQAVLGLVEDARARPVDDLGSDLLATVRRQAVQDDRVVRRRVDECASSANGANTAARSALSAS
jgi:hypothetical protein